MPVCPSCGALQPGGANFCDECGAGLEVAAASPDTVPAPVTVLICSNCYAQLEPVSRFCHMCGRPVRAATPPALSPASQRTSPAPPPSEAPSPSSDHPPGAAVQGRLVVHGTDATLTLPPGKAQIIIGREDPVSGIFPDIDLTNYGGDEGGVSRCHARIIVRRDEFLIEDLNSINCTYVNRQQLAPGQPHPLNSGDEIQLGRLRFNFESSPPPPAP
jgi:ribosomal protein L40E